MEQITQQIQEDIEIYISLHPEVTDDLIDHCAIMKDQLYQQYQVSL